MTNREVVERWKEGKKGRSLRMSTDGSKLLSYDLVIGYTTEDGRKVVRDYRKTGLGFRSQTTSHHVSLALSVGEPETAEMVGEKITKVIKDLQKYCHANDCDYFTECPTQHEECRASLNLATAIAWKAAKLAETVVTTLSKRDVEALLVAIASLQSVVWLHEESYGYLLDKLHTLKHLCRDHYKLTFKGRR